MISISWGCRLEPRLQQEGSKNSCQIFTATLKKGAAYAKQTDALGKSKWILHYHQRVSRWALILTAWLAIRKGVFEENRLGTAELKDFGIGQKFTSLKKKLSKNQTFQNNFRIMFLNRKTLKPLNIPSSTIYKILKIIWRNIWAQRTKLKVNIGCLWPYGPQHCFENMSGYFQNSRWFICYCKHELRNTV